MCLQMLDPLFKPVRKLYTILHRCHSQEESALFLQIHSGKSKELLDNYSCLDFPDSSYSVAFSSNNNQDVVTSQFLIKYSSSKQQVVHLSLCLQSRSTSPTIRTQTFCVTDLSKLG